MATGLPIFGPNLPFALPPAKRPIFLFLPGLIAGNAERIQFIDFAHLLPSIFSSFSSSSHVIALGGQRSTSSLTSTSPVSALFLRSGWLTSGGPSQNPINAKSVLCEAFAQSNGHALNLTLTLKGK